MEPNIPDSDRLESKWNCCADSLKKYYDTTRFKDLDWKFGKKLNVFGKRKRCKPNASLFHTTTKYLFFFFKKNMGFPLLDVFTRRKK